MTPAELRQRRLALRLSQEELGALLDMSRASINRWETGSPPIPSPRMLTLALERLEGMTAAEIAERQYVE